MSFEHLILLVAFASGTVSGLTAASLKISKELDKRDEKLQYFVTEADKDLEEKIESNYAKKDDIHEIKEVLIEIKTGMGKDIQSLKIEVERLVNYIEREKQTLPNVR